MVGARQCRKPRDRQAKKQSSGVSALDRGRFPGAASAAGCALKFDIDIAANRPVRETAVAPHAAQASHLIGSAPLQAKRQPVGAEKVLRCAEAAIDNDASARMVRNNDACLLAKRRTERGEEQANSRHKANTQL